jgi:uncharacterized protein
MEREALKALINVTRLLREPVGSSQSHDISGVIDEEVEGFVEGKAKVIRIGRGVLVQCELTGEVRLMCSRCLGTFSCLISFTAEERFLPMADVSAEQALSSPKLPEEFTIDGKNMLDLRELIRQYILLNLPMKPLCRPDCPGIKEANSYGATQEKNC